MRLYWQAFLGYYYPSRSAGLGKTSAIVNAIKLAIQIGH